MIEDEELDKLSITEQIERLTDLVEKRHLIALDMSSLLERLRLAAQSGLLTPKEEEALYACLVSSVCVDDFEYLSLTDENREAIFDCLNEKEKGKL